MCCFLSYLCVLHASVCLCIATHKYTITWAKQIDDVSWQHWNRAHIHNQMQHTPSLLGVFVLPHTFTHAYIVVRCWFDQTRVPHRIRRYAYCLCLFHISLLFSMNLLFFDINLFELKSNRTKRSKKKIVMNNCKTRLHLLCIKCSQAKPQFKISIIIIVAKRPQPTRDMINLCETANGYWSFIGYKISMYFARYEHL